MAVKTALITDLKDAIERLNQFNQENLVGPLNQNVLNLEADKKLKQIVSTHSLPQPLLEKLIGVFQSYTSLLNEVFGRSFVHHLSLNLSVDPIASKDKDGVLTHLRMLRGEAKVAITGGGLVDGNETMEEAARREFSEETGFGCQLKSETLCFVIDRVRSPNPYFFTVAYRGEYTGCPNDNHEGRDFKEIAFDEIPDHENWFSDHQFLVREALDPEIFCDYLKQGIRYTSGFPIEKAPYLDSKPFLPPLVDKADLLYVNDLIDRVTEFYTKLIEKFRTDVLAAIDVKKLAGSRDVIGHGWEDLGISAPQLTPDQKKLRDAWNDNAQLWNFLGPLKLSAIKISNFFGTFINTGEGGVITIACLMMNEDDVFMVKGDDDKYTLDHALLTQYRDFLGTIGHHVNQRGGKLDGNPILVGKYEPPTHVRKDGFRKRTFEFIVNLADKQVPDGMEKLSFRDARATPKEAWASSHDFGMFQHLMEFKIWQLANL
ncbi:MAG: hypothetical protein S4CHLAM20_14340 [Chlamydiia bacterium]|nr:hypothetical protein [Chlamydiia bacterium]